MKYPPLSRWAKGRVIGPARRGPREGQRAVVVRNLGAIPAAGHPYALFDTLRVRWPDDVVEVVSEELFLT